MLKQKKPNGQYLIASDKSSILEFMGALPVKKISGIGKMSAMILEGVLGIKTCRDIVIVTLISRLIMPLGFIYCSVKYNLLSSLNPLWD